MTSKKIRNPPPFQFDLTSSESSLFDIIMDTIQTGKWDEINAHSSLVNQFNLFSTSTDRNKLSNSFKEALDNYIDERKKVRTNNSIIENKFNLEIFDILKTKFSNTYMIMDMVLETDPYFYNERGEWSFKIPYHDLDKMKTFRKEIQELKSDPKYKDILKKEFAILADYSRGKTFGSEYKKEMQSVQGKRGITRDQYAQTLRVTSSEFAMLDISDIYYLLFSNDVPGRSRGEAAWKLRKQIPNYYPQDMNLPDTDEQTAIKNVLLCYDDIFKYEHNFKSLFEGFDNNRKKIWEEILRLYVSAEIEEEIITDVDGKPAKEIIKHKLESPVREDTGKVISLEGLAVDATYNVRDILKETFKDHLLPIEKVITTVSIASPKPSGFTPMLESEISIYFDLLYNTKRNIANQRTIWLFHDDQGASRFYDRLQTAFRDEDGRKKLGIPNYVKPVYTIGKDTVFTTLSHKTYSFNRLLKGIYNKGRAFIFNDGINYPIGNPLDIQDFKRSEQMVYNKFVEDITEIIRTTISEQVYEKAVDSKKASYLRGSKTDYPTAWEQDIISQHGTFKEGISYVNDLLVNFNIIPDSENSEIFQVPINLDQEVRITEKNRYAKVEPRGNEDYYADIKFSIDNNLEQNELGREFQLKTPLAEYNARNVVFHGSQKETRKKELTEYIIANNPHLLEESVLKTLDLIDSHFASQFLDQLRHLSFPEYIETLQESDEIIEGHEDYKKNTQLAMALIEGTIKENLTRAKSDFDDFTANEKNAVRGFFLTNPPKVEGLSADNLNKYIKIRLAWESPNYV